ncbi:MAG: penicillin acylase family protein, partial [Cyclobacteriaceae bacterium]
MYKLLSFILVSNVLMAQPFTAAELNAWKKQAQRVTIIRDQWGIAHVYGKSDADAVFGMLYAQCEDDFPRVEQNYINALGRLAEVEGEGKLYNDLRTRLFQDSTMAIQVYKTVPPAMKKLMQAFADGVNFFLATHPNVKPQLINRFQPWMPLLFSEGSIGGDIEAVSLTRLKDFYGDGRDATTIVQDNLDDGLEPEPKGSNGFAIAPSRSASGNALFMINPHTSFYFRPEIQVVSEEGLHAYGAVTWGQFFIYQGFNENCGWMHTTSMADAID